MAAIELGATSIGTVVGTIGLLAHVESFDMVVLLLACVVLRMIVAQRVLELKTVLPAPQ